MFAGISTGAAMAGAAKCAQAIDAGVIVVVSADGGWKYLSTGAWTDDIDDVVERAKQHHLLLIATPTPAPSGERQCGCDRCLGGSGHPHNSGIGCAMAEFLTDVKTLRKQARKHMDQGPITEAYGADRPRVISELNEVLATVLVCVLRYKRHYYMAQGIISGPVAAEFLEHANDEQGHADTVRGAHRAAPR